jgi:hypothetical protein
MGRSATKGKRLARYRSTQIVSEAREQHTVQVEYGGAGATRAHPATRCKKMLNPD